MKKLLLALLFLASPAYAQTQTQYYTVPTIAALKAMTTSRPAVVQVVDANPGIFNLSAGACAAADDIFQVQPTSGTTVCYTRMASKYATNNLADCLNITSKTFGGSGNGTTDNAAALAATYAALPTGGGCIFFPPGKYSFSTAVAYTFPNARKDVTLVGGGPDATILYWPNAAGGLTFTWANIANTLNVRDMSFTTAQGAGGTALSLINTNVWSGYQIDSPKVIERVFFRGDDGTSAANYWTRAIYVQAINYVNIEDVMVYGGVVATAKVGIGAELASDGAIITANFNIIGGAFLNLEKAIVITDEAQGVAITNTSLVDNEYGIDRSGTLSAVGLIVTGSNFNNRKYNINLDVDTTDVQITGNTFFIQADLPTPSYNVVFGSVSRFTFTGNNSESFVSVTEPALKIDNTNGWGGTVSGNTFNGAFATGIELTSASSLIGVSGNTFGATVVTPLTDAGTANDVFLGVRRANTWAGAQAFATITATSINKVGITAPASGSTLTIANGKTLTASNTLTLAGTDSTTMTFPATNATIARTDAGQTFTGTQAFGAITYTSLNGNTWAAGTGTLSIGAGKTLTASNTLTFTGTDSSSVAFGTGGTVQYAGAGAIALSQLATQATNTIVGNATSGSASPTALAIGTCSTSSRAIIWTTNTGFGCNTAINAATLGGSAIGTSGTTVPVLSAANTFSALQTFSVTGARSADFLNNQNSQVRIGTVGNYYDYGRSTADGFFHLTGSQTGFNGLVVDGVDGEFFRTVSGTTTITGTLAVTALSNAATTSSVCYNTSTKVFTYNSTIGTCTVSALRYKTPGRDITSDVALAGLAGLRTQSWTYKKLDGLDNRERVGLYADDVAKMDPRCAVYNDKKEIENYDDRCVLAYTIAAMKELKAGSDNLKTEIEQLKKTVK